MPPPRGGEAADTQTSPGNKIMPLSTLIDPDLFNALLFVQLATASQPGSDFGRHMKAPAGEQSSVIG